MVPKALLGAAWSPQAPWGQLLETSEPYGVAMGTLELHGEVLAASKHQVVAGARHNPTELASCGIFGLLQ